MGALPGLNLATGGVVRRSACTGAKRMRAITLLENSSSSQRCYDRETTAVLKLSTMAQKRNQHYQRSLTSSPLLREMFIRLSSEGPSLETLMQLSMYGQKKNKCVNLEHVPDV